MLHAIPLTILPLILYNLIGYGIAGADPWAGELFRLPMPAGVPWTLRLGDLLIVFAIAMLFLEVRKALRAPRNSIINQTFSTIVLIAYAAEFFIAAAAAHSVFLILTLLSLFDVAVGYTMSIRPPARVAPPPEAPAPADRIDPVL